MAPRIPSSRAMRAIANCIATAEARTFSSTASALSPPPGDYSSSSSSSSSSSLLNINSTTSSSSSSSSSNSNNSNSNSTSTSLPFRRGEAASNMLSRIKDGSQAKMQRKQTQLEYLRNQKNSIDYLRQMPRRWDAGDVYSPHDMSPVEMQKWRKRSPRGGDVVDALGIRPLDMYKNFSLVQEFTTTSGQIKHSAGTSLRPVNQRKIAKMIRRVQGMGIYPTIHDHPEMIRDDFYPEER